MKRVENEVENGEFTASHLSPQAPQPLSRVFSDELDYVMRSPVLLLSA